MTRDGSSVRYASLTDQEGVRTMKYPEEQLLVRENFENKGTRWYICFKLKNKNEQALFSREKSKI